MLRMNRFGGKIKVLTTGLTWLLILAGAIETVWGLCQVYGYTASNHSLYASTGSFYNPGPYSGFLAMCFPVCLHEWLKRGKSVGGYIALGVLLLMLCVLPAGMSRSAWLAAGIASVYIGWMHYKKKITAGIRKHKALTVGAFIAMSFAFCGAYQLKKDSADGRLLMWKVSVQAIKEKPLSGYGWDYVAGAYGDAQEKYFSKGEYTEQEERVAGSPEYVFNEYLQAAMAWGVPVLCVILLLVIAAMAGHQLSGNYGLFGAMLSLAVFSFSSYPFQFPLFVAALGLLVLVGLMG
jgi:O-antigen ligase